MSQAEGISRTAMLEIAIREAAKKRNIAIQTASKEKKAWPARRRRSDKACSTSLIRPVGSLLHTGFSTKSPPSILK
jgi:hypothetical protein